jgi:hypothetical protein
MSHHLTPTELTAEQQAKICGVLGVGCDWHTAANYAGCSLAEIRRAMRRDPMFAADVRRTEAGVELSTMRAVQKAIEDPKNWRAAVWWLERHAPERFARNAGVVTARQLKSFIAILADVINGGDQGPQERSQIIDRLKAFSESVDQLLRDERMTEPDAADNIAAEIADSCADFDQILNDTAFDEESP